MFYALKKSIKYLEAKDLFNILLSCKRVAIM